MPKTYPCADTTCRGQTMVDGTPCPDCQRRIDRAEREWNDREKERARLEWEHKHKNGKK